MSHFLGVAAGPPGGVGAVGFEGGAGFEAEEGDEGDEGVGAGVPWQWPCPPSVPSFES